MEKKRFAIIFLILISLFSNFVLADIGVGLSPSKMVLQVEGGKTQEIELMVFNSGDSPMEISLKGNGDIAEFIETEPSSITVDPEPKPHELPIKNGKTFVVKINPPMTMKTKTYSGSITAIGGPSSGSFFGGSVGVATQIELIVTPGWSIFPSITTTHIIIIAVIFLLLLSIFLLKKAGFALKIEKSKKRNRK